MYELVYETWILSELIELFTETSLQYISFGLLVNCLKLM